MNVIKYRPVGSPSGKVVRVRVSQSKRAIYGHTTAAGKRIPPQSRSVAFANKLMLSKGFVRAGVRYV